MSEVLFLGGVFNDNLFGESNAISPAANRWQKGFLEGLMSNNVNFVLISHLPHRIFPFGEFFVKTGCDDNFFNNSIGLSYFNLPFVRNLEIFIKIVFITYNLKRRNKNLKYLLSYNGATDNTLAAYVISKLFALKWIDICADHLDPNEKWSNYHRLAHRASGHIFLSYYAFLNAPFNSKYLLEGAIFNKSIKQDLSNDKFIILYSGMFSKWGGVDLLIEGFTRVINSDIELWICGHGNYENIKEEIKKDIRIKYFGFVTDIELHNLACKCNAFINPKPSKINGNKMNFPSKLLDYLSYKKPIISTWTPGLLPEYKEVLNILYDESPESISEEIIKIYNWKKFDYINHARRVERFSRNKSWSIQIRFLLKWMNSEI
jgi:glycosyltransferase involved in cell wall biosynthesis